MTSGQGAGVCTLWFDPADAGGEPMCSPDLSPDGQQVAAKITSDILYVLTNRQWPGTCERVVRPAFELGAAGVPCWTWWWGPDPDPRYPYGWASPFRPAGPRVRASTILRLPGPVADVTEVLIDGEILDPSAYQVQGTRTLVRVDGDDWPAQNDLTRAASTPRGDAAQPAWQITYLWGADPPDGAQAVAEALYCQVAAGMAGSDDCRLLWGARLTQVSRRGVNVSYESLTQFLRDGLTGVDEVDVWVTIARGGRWKPNGGGRVLRADAPRRRSRWVS